MANNKPIKSMDYFQVKETWRNKPINQSVINALVKRAMEKKAERNVY